MGSDGRLDLAYFPCGENKAPAVPKPLECRMPASECKPLVGLYAGQFDLLCIDFEVRSAFDAWSKIVEENGLEFEAATVATRGGGVHVWIRCEGGAPAGEKLAFNNSGEGPHNGLLVETRGSNNQYAIVPPSPGWEYFPLSTEIDELGYSADWEHLISAARMLDERAPAAAIPSKEKSWEDYELRGESFDAVLERNGWVRLSRIGRDGRSQWRRPGKDRGISGTLTADGKVFTCFTSSTAFNPGNHYGKSAALAILEYGGDFKACAKALYRSGYGQTKAEREAETADLPVIETNGAGLRTLGHAAINALKIANEKEPILFVRTGRLAVCRQDEHGISAIRYIDANELRALLADVAVWVSTSDKRGQIEVLPPIAACEYVLAQSSFPFPALRGVAPAPVLGNGKVQLSDGYCESSGYVIASGVDWRPATERGAVAAKWLLDEVLCDFPFQSEADKANALALMVLPFVRPSLRAPTPLHLVDAPTMGTGKTMLVKTCLFPFLGIEASATTAPKEEEEWRKKIGAMLGSGAPYMFIDNISRRVESDSLASALTSTTFTDRVLGSSSMVNLPIEVTWCGTANNAQLSVDLARRSVWIRLDSMTEKPWQREGFKHPDLFGWMKKERVKIVAAILSMIREWTDAGRPSFSGKALGSFEVYSKTIGGILETCGVEGFLSNWEIMFESTNSEEESWRGFYQKWHKEYGDQPMKAGDLYDVIKEFEDLYAFLGDGNESSQRKRLGHLLKKRAGRVVGGLRIQKSIRVGGHLKFKMENVEMLLGFSCFSTPNAGEYREETSTDTLGLDGGKSIKSITPPEWPIIEDTPLGRFKVFEDGTREWLVGE